ncbi:MAG: hypothetical protein EPN97_01720 [Alphaproteobacteria bacterium]|nr:MAG: hypothetical protein EPN97_01720 [Alphaproteobacteria bacterium]
MKAAFIALAALSALFFFAAFNPSPGDAAQVSAPPLANLPDNDTLVFVEGEEAEPPAMPEGLTTPEPQASAAPVAKAITYVRPEDLKKQKNRLIPRRVHAIPANDGTGAVTFDIPPDPAAKPVYKRPVFHYNE